MEGAELERGRSAYATCRWAEAHACLTAADRVDPLAADDLELLARASYMLGRDDEYLGGLERAHQAHLESGEIRRAVRCTWWIGHNHLFRGEVGPASGWFARGGRLLERVEDDCAERGYLLCPAMLERFMAGDFETAHDMAVEIAQIGFRHDDHDLAALGVMAQGRALMRLGRTDEGLRLVDESMVSVTAGELSPIVAGIVYCETIAFCYAACELRRAREWTSALTRWCEQQPDMVAHNGLCLVHRAELMTLSGSWEQAHAELEQVSGHNTDGVLNQHALGRAAYADGELYRLRGDFEAAEAAYRQASRFDHEPQPGLALLRLAQGDGQTAAAAIRRATRDLMDPLTRAALLPAYVEIVIAVDDLDAARSACRELQELAVRYGRTELLNAWTAQAHGAVALADGDADSALAFVRAACDAWRELHAPYERARARAFLALAFRAVGDEDTAALELEAARAVFEELGAQPAIAWVDSLMPNGQQAGEHGLTARELEILRLVAVGRSNREVAAELVISERTVARHLQNIFAKLRVSSRTAASAYAFEHDLA